NAKSFHPVYVTPVACFRNELCRRSLTSAKRDRNVLCWRVFVRAQARIVYDAWCARRPTAMSALALGVLMSGCGVVGCVGTSVYGIGLTVC
ncbi:hypothetical protein, partial [Caballeronia sp. RCC_10]|uniref:hypothetical protein n=1 Tax=Caballeronia sp. RCC_10 TaxID=3239227 RepID=UPI00352540F9